MKTPPFLWVIPWESNGETAIFFGQKKANKETLGLPAHVSHGLCRCLGGQSRQRTAALLRDHGPAVGAVSGEREETDGRVVHGDAMLGKGEWEVDVPLRDVG